MTISPLAAWLGAALLACNVWAQVTPPQAPEPSFASVKDTAEGGGMAGGTFFVIREIDGKVVEDNALLRSRSASFNKGMEMVLRGFEHKVPPGRVRLGLFGTHTTAAPISQIFTALFRGGIPEVSGFVEVDLEAGKQYRVNGLIDAYHREVWLEDAEGHVLPNAKITVAPDPEAVKAMEGAAYTATNLRYEDDWISDAPWPHLPLIPLGSRLKVIEYGRNRASVLIDGRKMRVGVDYARSQMSIQQMIELITTNEDPRPQLAAMPEVIRNAIRAGRVVPGMTAAQVLLALGRPRMDTTPELDSAEWLYHVIDSEEAFLVFDGSGRLKEVDASRKARGQILYQSPTGSVSPSREGRDR